jgi:thioredoxin 1
MRLVLGMENIKHLDGPTFEADVLESELPVVVDFSADWCPPCKMLAPVLDRLAAEYQGKVTVGEIDVDANQDIAIRYSVMAMPTLGLFRGGKMIDRMVGYPGSATPIREWINKHVPTETKVEPKAADVKPAV